MSQKSEVSRVLLLIEVVPQEVVRMLREPSGPPGADILAARTDALTQDQGSRP